MTEMLLSPCVGVNRVITLSPIKALKGINFDDEEVGAHNSICVSPLSPAWLVGRDRRDVWLAAPHNFHTSPLGGADCTVALGLLLPRLGDSDQLFWGKWANILM